jgi:hypothetical protein
LKAHHHRFTPHRPLHLASNNFIRPNPTTTSLATLGPFAYFLLLRSCSRPTPSGDFHSRLLLQVWECFSNTSECLSWSSISANLGVPLKADPVRRLPLKTSTPSLGVLLQYQRVPFLVINKCKSGCSAQGRPRLEASAQDFYSKSGRTSPTSTTPRFHDFHSRLLTPSLECGSVLKIRAHLHGNL